MSSSRSSSLPNKAGATTYTATPAHRSVRGQSGRRANRGQTHGELANGRRGKIISPIRNKQEFFPKTLTEDNAPESFAVVLSPYSDGEIATAGGVTKDAAKKYRQGKAMPRSIPLLKMAVGLDGVWEWILHTQGDAHPESSKSVDALLRAALKQVEGRQ